MVRLMPVLDSNSRFALLCISVSRVYALLDEPQRYVLEENVPRRESRDLRRVRQGAVRLPSLRTMVRTAVQRKNAREFDGLLSDPAV
jgi:hypothetical protein